ncbi:MAG: hypothetical protein AAGI38_10690, partial [Bacteroidota bacterium]
MPRRRSIIVMLAVAALAAAVQPARAADEKEDGDTPVSDRGFFLGDFQIKDLRPVEGAKSTLRFSLHAHVVGPEVESFKRFYRHREQRVRNQVIISSRLAEPADFRDPELRR